MPGTKLLFFISLLLLFTYACKKDNSNNENREEKLLTRMTDPLGVSTYNYDGQKRLLSVTFKSNNESRQHSFVATYSDFNTKGSPAKQTSLTTTSGLTTTALAEYDMNNRVVKVTFFDSDGGLNLVKTYRYLTNTVEVVMDDQGYLSKDIYTLDEKGNLKTVETYNSNNVLGKRTTYKTYDDKRGIVAKNAFEAVVRSKNNPVFLEILEPDISGMNLQNYLWDYEYDKEGYITKATVKYVNTGETSVTTFEY